MGESFERQKNETGETIPVSCDAVVLGMQQPITSHCQPQLLAWAAGMIVVLCGVRLNLLELFKLHKITQERAINK